MNWDEKYRATTLDEICNQTIIINALKKISENKNIPHLIFYGPPGSGKTSTIHALTKQIFDNEYENRIIELNASNERGINIIREKIKSSAKQSININIKYPNWKFIILDDADTLTQDAQFALRRIIEQFSKITRFCLICNQINKIIEPIKSRCALFHFKSISNENIKEKLLFILKNENISNYSENIIQKIINYSNNDLRKAINMLNYIYNNKNNNENESLIVLNNIIGIEPNINTFLNDVFNHQINNVNNYIKTFFINGYSFINQILYIHNWIMNINIDDELKIKINNMLINVEQNMSKGGDEYIQIMKLAYYIMQLIE